MNWKNIKKAIKTTIKEIRESFKKRKAGKKKVEGILSDKNFIHYIVWFLGTISLVSIGFSSCVYMYLFGLDLVTISDVSLKLVLYSTLLLPVGILWDWFWRKVEKNL